jgi:hypothetical protein
MQFTYQHNRDGSGSSQVNRWLENQDTHTRANAGEENPGCVLYFLPKQMATQRCVGSEGQALVETQRLEVR